MIFIELLYKFFNHKVINKDYEYNVVAIISSTFSTTLRFFDTN